MIEIIENKFGFPISVIVPLQEKRIEFFSQFTLPLLQANNPVQIIINDNPGNAAKKRNEGFEKATQPFICFLDDDKLLPKKYLETLYNAILFTKDIDFVYTGYTGIVLHPDTHPCKNNYTIPPKSFDKKRLFNNNYIDTTSLMRKSVFPGFDEMLPQHDDWDMYCNMVSKGAKGMAVDGIKFFSFYLDEGITSVNNKDCSHIIHKKYEKL